MLIFLRQVTQTVKNMVATVVKVAIVVIMVLLVKIQKTPSPLVILYRDVKD